MPTGSNPLSVGVNGRRWLAAIGAVVVLGAAGVWFVTAETASPMLDDRMILEP